VKVEEDLDMLEEEGEKDIDTKEEEDVDIEEEGSVGDTL
jgi:hypothetical protein